MVKKVTDNQQNHPLIVLNAMQLTKYLKREALSIVLYVFFFFVLFCFNIFFENDYLLFPSVKILKNFTNKKKILKNPKKHLILFLLLILRIRWV
jgi:hypothetical protein